MKKILKSLAPVVTAILCSVALAASAQTTVVTVIGPSEATTTAPPATAAAVSKIYCAGTPINLTGPTFTAGYKYDWYKIDQSGTAQLVKEGTADNTYTENPTGPGYYDYQLVVINSANCASQGSGTKKVFVLPTLTVAVPVPDPICTANTTATTLKLDPTTLPAGYTYTYQWYLGANKITTAAGTAGPTYDVPSSGTTTTYKLEVGFALMPSGTCTTFSNDIPVSIVAPPQQPSIIFN